MVSRKTTLRRVSDILRFDATETLFIPLRSWRRAQQPAATRFTIGVVVLEGSDIELRKRLGTYNDKPHHNGQ